MLLTLKSAIEETLLGGAEVQGQLEYWLFSMLYPYASGTPMVMDAEVNVVNWQD